MHDAIIIGGGLFGQIIAKALQRQGRDVLVLDCNKPDAGSRPAACLMKPSWFSSLGKEVYDPALKILDELYGLCDLQFVTRPKLARVTVHWIPPSEILCGRTWNAKAVRVDSGVVVLDTGETVAARLIVVAAGIWVERLLPQYRQVGQKGVAFLWSGAHVFKPFIRPWAPYRQLVAFNRGDGLWASDGTAIKAENWTQERLETSRQRVSKSVSNYTANRWPSDIMTGIRPYDKGHRPCLLEEVEGMRGVWVASGGAKNGTLAAGYCAHVIRERTS